VHVAVDDEDVFPIRGAVHLRPPFMKLSSCRDGRTNPARAGARQPMIECSRARSRLLNGHISH
jgi:hypothetical protein